MRCLDNSGFFDNACITYAYRPVHVDLLAMPPRCERMINPPIDRGAGSLFKTGSFQWIGKMP